MLKLRQLTSDIAVRLAELSKALTPKSHWTELIRGPDEHLAFSALRVGRRYFLLCQTDDQASASDIVARLKPVDFDALDLGVVELIEVGVLTPRGWDGGLRSTVTRGVVVTPFHDALASLVGLPAGWQASHGALLDQTLRPIGPAEARRFASMTAVSNGHGGEDAVEWLESQLAWDRPSGALVYLQAEGGKGKSTLLAHVASSRTHERVGPLPVYLPLRNVLRGGGVSWAQLAATLGVIGPAADNLRHAVRSGVATLFLDGLDEISGRYDPNLISDVVGVLRKDCTTDRSLIVISGRTTEGALIGDAATLRARLELPTADSEEFEKYVRAVTGPTCAELANIARRCPETPWQGPINFRALGVSEEDALVEWIRIVFDTYGRDKSLFFVQSLAAIGRSKQLSGNARLVIHSDTRPPEVTYFAACGIDEVCNLAASLACVREQGKTDPIAEGAFQPLRQLDVLSLLAVCRAGVDGFPALTPNDLTKLVFAVDPTNQAELWIAIVRQVQKHALLMSSADGLVVGEWRPVFLSDWIRAALILRAWSRRAELTAMVSSDRLPGLIVSAERGQVAFGTLMPSAVARQAIDASDLAETLCSIANTGSDTACANYWWFRAGLSTRGVEHPHAAPNRLIELADLTEIQFDGEELGAEFSGEMVQLVGAEFQDVSLCGSRLSACALSDAVFDRCTLRDVELRYCDGPTTFSDCTFERCRILDARGRDMPLMRFINCRFDAESRIEQHDQPGAHWKGEPIVQFQNCTVADAAASPRRILGGEFLGLPATSSVAGLQLESDAAAEDPAEACARSTLGTFFPLRAGSGSEFQARDYIRSSAIGRGRMPDGAPTRDQLTNILKAEGFSDGGREGHLYAPWSQVGGVTEEGKQLKNQLIAFLRGRDPSPRIQAIIERVRKAGAWR